MLSAVLFVSSEKASFFCSTPSLIFSLFSRSLSVLAERDACFIHDTRHKQPSATHGHGLGARWPGHGLNIITCGITAPPRRPGRAQDRGGGRATRSDLIEFDWAHLARLLGGGELLLNLGRAVVLALGRELFQALLHGRLGCARRRLEVELEGDRGFDRHLVSSDKVRAGAGSGAGGVASGRECVPTGLKAHKRLQQSACSGLGRRGSGPSALDGSGEHKGQFALVWRQA